MMLSYTTGQLWADRQLHGQLEVCLSFALITVACNSSCLLFQQGLIQAGTL